MPALTVTVKGSSTVSMTLVCPFGLLLPFWTLLLYLLFLVEPCPYVIVALQSSICSACFSLDPFCPRMAFQRCPCASILFLLLVQQLGSLTTFCRFLSLFRLDVSVGLWSPECYYQSCLWNLELFQYRGWWTLQLCCLTVESNVS